MIAIVGAGVSGLTCGVVLQEHGYDVTLFESPAHKASSPVAAAIWYPYAIDAATEQWGLESYRKFEELARDPATGVSMVQFTVTGMAPAGFDRVPLIETPVYLPWLRERLRGRIQERTIDDLSTLEADIVVNCSGLGARTLCDDPEVKPGRGVVLLAKNPGITRHMASLDGQTLTYVLTRRDDVILGGTDDETDDEQVPVELLREIHERCVRVEPRLPAEYTHTAGFRPHREQVRLGHEAGTRIIHNYGHGGAGFTVSWGCARKVLEDVQSLSSPR